jgi:GNAT superfamily N-acetyltransferase
MSATACKDIMIDRIANDFDRWDELLELILRAFAYMDGVIDPPSSALRLTAGSLREKARQETGFLATDGTALRGCLFITERAGDFYLGKLAVDPDSQGLGIGRRLLEATEYHARRSGKPAIELQTRIELLANHATFQRLGFNEVARTAHDGYDRPTSVTMRKVLS